MNDDMSIPFEHSCYWSYPNLQKKHVQMKTKKRKKKRATDRDVLDEFIAMAERERSDIDKRTDLIVNEKVKFMKAYMNSSWIVMCDERIYSAAGLTMYIKWIQEGHDIFSHLPSEKRMEKIKEAWNRVIPEEDDIWSCSNAGLRLGNCLYWANGSIETIRGR